MDQGSFDRLARLLGEATDRRAGLRAALGAVLGGGAVAALDADAGAKHKGKDARSSGPQTGKRKKRKTCKPACGSGYDCVKEGRQRVCVCATGVTCGDACCRVGQVCAAGACVPEPQPSACLAFGEPCKNAGRRCCDGLSCASGQDGSFPVACYKSKGAPCGDTAECPYGMRCTGGICVGIVPPVRCAAERDACDAATPCCDGLTCTVGTCIAGPRCIAEGGSGCSDAGDCCDGLTCDGGTCVAPPQCVAVGGSCASATCCTGLICMTGTSVCTACSIVSSGNPTADGTALEALLEAATDGNVITIGPGDYILPGQAAIYVTSTTQTITIKACDPAVRPMLDGGATVTLANQTTTPTGSEWSGGNGILGLNFDSNVGSCGSSGSGATCAGYVIEDIDFRNSGGGWGGAIEAWAPVSVTNSAISRCKGRAGGIRSRQATTLKNVQVTQCYGTYADAYAGGIFVGATSTLEDVTVRYNAVAVSGTALKPSAGGVTASMDGGQTVTIKGTTTIRDNTPNGFFAFRTDTIGSDGTIMCESPAKVCGNPSNSLSTGILNCNGLDSTAGNIVFDASCTPICVGGPKTSNSPGDGSCLQ